jgi:hypothetical protein
MGANSGASFGANLGAKLGIRLGANPGIRPGGRLWFGSSLASFRRTRRECWPHEPWTTEQLLHLALAAVAIVGWSLVYVTLMRGVDPPQVARDSLRTEASLTLVPQTSDRPLTAAAVR